MKQLGRLLSGLTWLLIVGSVIIISGGLLGRPLLVASVPTTSMTPTLKPGDLIVVLPTWLHTHPGLGDIIVFKTAQDRNWIVHRIVDGNASEGFVTKGDANPIADPNRVMPRDMAGVVPQFQGRAMRMPRLGALRLDNGPLSSPLVAGAALVVGIFLVLLDIQPVRVPHMRQHRRGRPASHSILYVYLGLAGTAFLTTLIPAWTLSSEQAVAYSIVSQRPVNVVLYNKYLPGQVHREEIVIPNPSPLPLSVVFASNTSGLTYAPWSTLIPPRGKATVVATISNTVVGEHTGWLRTGVFMPVLPAWLLQAAARRSLLLAALLTALVPAIAVLGLAFLDARVRFALQNVRTQFRLRLSQI